VYPLSLAETIVAVSTPPGTGGIGIVRLSGPRALPIAGSFFYPRTKDKTIPPDRAVFGVVRNPANGIPMDEGFLLYFKAPRSYTGEDVVEISLHGSPVVLEEIVRMAVVRGARPALPGEFTLRAFLSGRLDILQAEAVDDLIKANSLAQAKLAYRGIEGALSKKIGGLRKETIGLVARVEALIEFPDEALPVSDQDLLVRLDRLAGTVETLIRSHSTAAALSGDVTLALVGRTNVGKSTLFNDLLEEQRAIVTPYAGTTRDFLRERIRIRDTAFALVDMAGLGPAKSGVEREGIRRGKKIASAADGLLLLVDGSRRFSSEDRELIDSYKNRKMILVLNKTDLPPKTGPDDLRARYPEAPILEISALRKKGLADLREKIHELFAPIIPSDEIVVFRTRDKLLLEEALAHLRRAKDMAARGQAIEMIAEEVRLVIGVIGRLTGEIRSDDVINDIFSRFCVGK
jgi:tRNA modification GTPase